jgi:L-asparagine transporter-like permease
MAYAELATLRPRAGGEYVYLRDAYGPLAAFLSGWTSFVAGFSGAIAAGAVALADYVGRFAPAAADRTPLLTVPLPYVPLIVTPQALVAIAAIVGLSMIHLHGSGRIVHNLLAGAKVSALVVFIAIGLSIGNGNIGHLTSQHVVADPSTAWLLALIPVMFSYSGWNAAAYVAEEIREPGRNVPRSLAIGTVAVVIVYLALNILYLYAMPIAELGALDGRLTDVVAERLFGFVAGNVLACFTIVSIAASISAMVLPARASTTRWGATACSSGRRAACTRATARRCSPSSRRRSGARSSCCRARCRSWSPTPALRSSCFRGLPCSRSSSCAGATRRASAVQGARLSAGAGTLRPREPRDGDQRNLEQPTARQWPVSASSSPASRCTSSSRGGDRKSLQRVDH